MLHSLLLFVMGIGFLGKTFGWANDNQGRMSSILETSRRHTNSEYSTERRKNEEDSQLFTDRQKSIKAEVQHSVTSSVDRFPFGVEISGSSGSTLKIPEKIGKKHFQRNLHKTQNSGGPKISFDSVSTPFFGQYMRLSRSRFINKRLMSLIGKLGSREIRENIPVQGNKQTIQNQVSGVEKITSTESEITTNWSEFRINEVESNNDIVTRNVRRESAPDNELLPVRFGTNNTSNISEDVNKTYVDNICNQNDASNCNVSNSDDNNSSHNDNNKRSDNNNNNNRNNNNNNNNNNDNNRSDNINNNRNDNNNNNNDNNRSDNNNNRNDDNDNNRSDNNNDNNHNDNNNNNDNNRSDNNNNNDNRNDNKNNDNNRSDNNNNNDNNNRNYNNNNNRNDNNNKHKRNSNSKNNRSDNNNNNNRNNKNNDNNNHNSYNNNDNHNHSDNNNDNNNHSDNNNNNNNHSDNNNNNNPSDNSSNNNNHNNNNNNNSYNNNDDNNHSDNNDDNNNRSDNNNNNNNRNNKNNGNNNHSDNNDHNSYNNNDNNNHSDNNNDNNNHSDNNNNNNNNHSDNNNNNNNPSDNSSNNNNHSDNNNNNNNNNHSDNNDDNNNNNHIDNNNNNNNNNNNHSDNNNNKRSSSSSSSSSNNNRSDNDSITDAIGTSPITKVIPTNVFTNAAEIEVITNAKNLLKSEKTESENTSHIRKFQNVSILSRLVAENIQQMKMPKEGFRLLSTVPSVSPGALISHNLVTKKRLGEDNEKTESRQTLPKANIEKLLESLAGNSKESCRLVFKALFGLITKEKTNKSINSKTKRFDKRTANETKEQTSIFARSSRTTQKGHSMSTISSVANSSRSPNKSSFLNPSTVSTKSVSVKSKVFNDSVPVSKKLKNVSSEFSKMNNKSMSTIMSMLKKQSTPATTLRITSKFISTVVLTTNKSTTSAEHNKLNNNSASTKSPGCTTSDNFQTNSEKDSVIFFISQLLRHLRTPIGNKTLIEKHGSDMKNKTVSSILQLIDYITSFMKLSYSVIEVLMNKTNLKTDIIDKQTNINPLSTKVSVVKEIFTSLISDMFVPIRNKPLMYNSRGSENDQSQSRKQNHLTNEINKQVNVTKIYLTSDGNTITVQQNFRALINLARSDNKYVKEWSDSVLAFLSKQSHHFMGNGIYERLSSFWPRSSLTSESWTLRVAGYCAQIEIDEKMAAVDSRPLFCPFKNPECDLYSKYRNPTGICNNLENPLWGSANIPFRRQLMNVYDDGVSKPRIFGKDRVPLPSAKLISKSVFDKNDNKADGNLNLFTVFFTQFVSHDITRFAMDIGDIGPVKVNCCLPDTLNRSECFPIFFEKEKEPTGNASVRCLHFLRSMPTVPLGCQSHVREQVNQVTSFVDASNVYGSSLQEMNELRLFQRGLMKTALCGPESLPPTDRNGASECGINSDQRQFPCFYAGDPRVNENPALALVHMVWLREHNRIARRLGEINTHWDDTRLYEETRKIVSALMQHIVYNELLPVILGYDKAKEFGLLSGVEFFKDYEPKTNPTLENGFAAAAFRFGHGMVSDQFLFLAGCPSAHSKCSPDSILNGPKSQEGNFASNSLIAPPMCPYMTQRNVSTMFENVDVFHQSETELESLLRGLLMQPAEVATDTMLTPAITEKLFGHMDLMARNVQRGRDHGLPAYNKWREWCGLPVARNFHSNKTGFIDHKIEVVKRFAQVYNHPEDVDLIIGGLTEIPIEGAILGPTFVCLIGRQFRELKFGDHFWYEIEGQFTQDQLREIRMMQVSHILLNNAGIESVPKSAFYKGSNDNPFITSVDQVQLELSLWKEDDESRAK